MLLIQLNKNRTATAPAVAQMKKTMNENQNTGKQGEFIARQFYEKECYAILEANWQAGHLEIDIIAQNDDTVVFCEVKTRKKRLLVEPEAAVNKQNNVT